MSQIYNWGRNCVVEGDLTELSHDILKMSDDLKPYGIARGNGLNYGDAGLADKMYQLSGTGIEEDWTDDLEIGVDASITVGEVLDYLNKKGYSLAVVPGASGVTIGGAIAADVHGKNHPVAGSFSRVVSSFKVLLASGEIIQCSATENQDIFWSSFGAMGLTGIILSAVLRIEPVSSSYFTVNSVGAKTIDDLLSGMDSEGHYDYQVAWMDLSDRQDVPAVLSMGKRAEVRNLAPDVVKEPFRVLKRNTQLSVPFSLGVNILTPRMIKAFNRFYFRWNGKRSHRLLDYRSFYFPLDKVRNWNRLYGRHGFIQYQYVISKEYIKESIEAARSWLFEYGLTPSLSVLKRMGGREPRSELSFPMEGYTLALDLPNNKRTLKFAGEMDTYLIENGGRVYLAKDLLLSKEPFQRMYPGYREFMELKNKIDPENRIRSLQSLRLGLTTGKV